jgi:hypothetical protein
MEIPHMATARPSVWRPGRPGLLARIAAGAAWTAASLFAAALAVVFAATLVAVGLAAGAVLAVGVLVMRLGRPAKPRPGEPDVIEAHHVGGHTWVAYGWDGRP